VTVECFTLAPTLFQRTRCGRTQSDTAVLALSLNFTGGRGFGFGREPTKDRRRRVGGKMV